MTLSTPVVENSLDYDDVDLLGVGCEAGPDAGEAGQGRGPRPPDHQRVRVPGLSQVGQEGRRVEPDEVQLGQTVLVPDEGGVDMVNAGHQVHPGVTDQGTDGGLGLEVPQHRPVKVVDNEVEVGGQGSENLLNVLSGGSERALNLQDVLRDGGQNLLDGEGGEEANSNLSHKSLISFKIKKPE